MPTPGLYSTNATGEVTPVLVEDESGDTDLLAEIVEENRETFEQILSEMD